MNSGAMTYPNIITEGMPDGSDLSFGLAADDDDDDEPVQAGAGGNRAQQRCFELVIRGTVRHTANVLGTAPEQPGGFTSAARDPPPGSFVAGHAAIGAISFALSLGEAMLSTPLAERALA